MDVLVGVEDPLFPFSLFAFRGFEIADGEANRSKSPISRLVKVLLFAILVSFRQSSEPRDHQLWQVATGAVLK
jgi:hypothetical protein